MADPELVVRALAGVIGLNLVTCGVWRHDKHAAVTRERRVPEATVLLLAALGGSPAAKLAQRCLRHKTRKEPFRTRLDGVIVLQLALCLVSPIIARYAAPALAGFGLPTR